MRPFSTCVVGAVRGYLTWARASSSSSNNSSGRFLGTEEYSHLPWQAAIVLRNVLLEKIALSRGRKAKVSGRLIQIDLDFSPYTREIRKTAWGEDAGEQITDSGRKRPHRSAWASLNLCFHWRSSSSESSFGHFPTTKKDAKVNKRDYKLLPKFFFDNEILYSMYFVQRTTENIYMNTSRTLSLAW